MPRTDEAVERPSAGAPVGESYGLRPEDVAEILAVFACYPAVETALVFGSRAKGNYRPGSDVDIALKGHGLTRRMVVDMADVLNEETIMPYHFDLFDYDAISNPDLVAHIDRVGRSLFSVPGSDHFARKDE